MEKVYSSQEGLDEPMTRSSQQHGGLKTMPFIIANEAFEKVATYGSTANMILYLTGAFNMEVVMGAQALFLWTAISYFLPIVGALVSDSYLGKFRVIVLASLFSLTGMVLLWLTTMIPSASPKEGEKATPAQLALLFSSFAFMAIGAGGIRPCSIAFGADQFNKPESPGNEGVLQTFFNWYYASVGVSIMVAVTIIVYIQDHKGWRFGFGIVVLLMLLSTILFVLGNPYYVKVKPTKSLFIGFAKVLVAAWKNKDLVLSPTNSIHACSYVYHHHRGSKLVAPTNNLRNPSEENLKLDGSARKPWSLCTVDQVEDLKSLMRVIPIWSTGIMVSVVVGQNSFFVLQAKNMNRHITSSFQFPAGSFVVFTILTYTIWLVVCDKIIVMLVSKVKKQKGSLTDKQRMGIGILLVCASMIVWALVENIRRKRAIEHGMSKIAHSVVDMSAFWLVPQHCLIGVSEAFNFIAQIKFYYTQFPKNMASIAVALFSVGVAVGNLVGTLIVKVVDKASKGSGNQSWLSSNLNQGHYDYYYWVLAVLSFVNFLYFLVCSWAYGSENNEEGIRVLGDDGEEVKEKNMHV
ncbi:protein NRT1/ PTR FAMILY 1.1-like isoform X2 [Papaver somniferum]|uniref:protein NRT1/ PTR FAMILY 1.1-like isoform X2 n=1 Tax=Papaver somniferum TaxID=3469 RepID=UPI000E6F765A|nr:protein NRT1/ PTR FAMILY 1.1-like isoform X2 [Papaver somniferum]